MSPEPQREIEKDLLAYKQRRREQLAAPMELHPATRKMLQSEVARAASRPLLTSEEAAKNFVRSFVMSHQQPGFFARHKHRVIWSGAMFACLAVVLAVLRNDPQRTAQQRTFSDALPTPPQIPEPQPAKPQVALATDQKSVEAENLLRMKQPAPTADKPQGLAKVSASPNGQPAHGSPRGVVVASAQPTVAMREPVAGRSVVPPMPLPAINAPAAAAGGASAPAPISALGSAKSGDDFAFTPWRDSGGKPAERRDLIESVQLAKFHKSAQPLVTTFDGDAKKGADAEVKLSRGLGDEMKRAQMTTTTAGVGGSVGAAPVLATALEEARRSAGSLGAEAAQTRQRFLQLDSQSSYRKNFNSPPMPQVMQDFAFERTGDRVRIVDADGSIYEGAVMPAPAEQNRSKSLSQLDSLKERKDTLSEQTQSADLQPSYRFYASGVNRKLNQTVEFRGEWQPAVPSQAGQGTSALQPVSFGTTQLELQAAEKKDKAAGAVTLADTPTSAKANFNQLQKESGLGRITGRAVVGGRNEFDINAVPK